MLNAPHILETALLILLAFLVGCVIGSLARRLTTAKAKPAGDVATVAPASEPAPQLVVAPTIAPLPASRPRLSAAGRLAAAAGPEPDEPVTAPPVAAPAMQPARAPGAATSGIVVPTPLDAPAERTPAPEPTAPLVMPEPQAAPVRAEDVPLIDEAAHITAAPEAQAPELPAPDVGPAFEPAVPEPGAPAPVVESEPVAAAAEPEDRASAPQPAPSAPEQVLLAEDTEAAAMRAVEGGWTPRSAPIAPQRPVPHPEQASAEVDAAMATARTAVAAATAAANAAIAETSESVSPGLDFDPGRAAALQSFLDTDPEPEPRADAAAAESPGLNFEPQRPRSGYGRPESLPEPRGGEKDNLKQIKGITPALEASLNGLGIFHFDQIAAWDQKAIVWLDHNLTLKGRVGREKWLEQARELARGRAPQARPVRR